MLDVIASRRAQPDGMLLRLCTRMDCHVVTWIVRTCHTHARCACSIRRNSYHAVGRVVVPGKGDLVRLSVVLLLLALLGVVGGAALIGLPAVGGAVIFDSLCVGVWALARDDGLPGVPEVAPQVQGVSLAQVLERARRAS